MWYNKIKPTNKRTIFAMIKEQKKQFYEYEMFTKKQVTELTGLTYNSLHYLDYQINLISPKMTIQGSNKVYYTYKQLIELNFIKHLKNCGIDYKKIKEIKNVLQKINGDNDLTDKCIIYGYGQLFFVKKDEYQDKVIELTSYENNQTTLIKHFLLEKIENELRENVIKSTSYSKELVTV